MTAVVSRDRKPLNRAELIKLKIAEANSTKSEEKIMEVFLHVLDLIESEFIIKGTPTVKLLHTHAVFTELLDLETSSLYDIYVDKMVELLQKEGFLVGIKCIGMLSKDSQTITNTAYFLISLP